MRDQLKLRVLTGRRAGAELPLTFECMVMLGHDLSCDIVLREPGCADCRMGILPRAEGLSTIRPVAGEARLMGGLLPLGVTTGLPAYVPVGLGGGSCRFAIGGADEARWREAALLANESAFADGPEDSSRAGETDGAPPARARWPMMALTLFGTAALPLSIALLLSNDVVLGESPFRSPEARARHSLQQAGYGHLGVRARPDGGLHVSGRVDGARDEIRIARLLEPMADARLELVTDPEVAGRIVDLARMMDIEARVEPVGGGRFEAVLAGADPARRAAFARLVRQDMPEVKSLLVQEPGDGPHAAPIAPQLVAGKQVVAVVAGKPAFLVTADGARYFPGSVLPTGHRLVSVGPGEALFELRGVQTRMRF